MGQEWDCQQSGGSSKKGEGGRTGQGQLTAPCIVVADSQPSAGGPATSQVLYCILGMVATGGWAGNRSEWLGQKICDRTLVYSIF